jgi:hypothetical protein
LNRLVELAADPEPGEAEAAGEQTGEPEVTTPATDETAVDTGEEKQAEV